MHLPADIPLNFRQRSVFFYNQALLKYSKNEAHDSRLNLNQIVNHSQSVRDQALALERLDWDFGLQVCCLSLEVSILLHDDNALGVLEFYYLNHLKKLKLLNERDLVKIEGIWLLYKFVINGESGMIEFGHLMELWKIGNSENDPNHQDLVRIQIRSLNNIGCLLGSLALNNLLGQNKFLHASSNHFQRALSNPFILSREREIIQHNKTILDKL